MDIKTCIKMKISLLMWWLEYFWTCLYILLFRKYASSEGQHIKYVNCLKHITCQRLLLRQKPWSGQQNSMAEMLMGNLRRLKLWASLCCGVAEHQLLSQELKFSLWDGFVPGVNLENCLLFTAWTTALSANRNWRISVNFSCNLKLQSNGPVKRREVSFFQKSN